MFSLLPSATLSILLLLEVRTTRKHPEIEHKSSRRRFYQKRPKIEKPSSTDLDSFQIQRQNLGNPFSVREENCNSINIFSLHNITKVEQFSSVLVLGC